jgi:hypothetical protein
MFAGVPVESPESVRVAGGPHLRRERAPEHALEHAADPACAALSSRAVIE